MAAKAEKDPKTGKWLIQYRYTDWQGNRKKSMKRALRPKEKRRNGCRIFLQQNRLTSICSLRIF